MMESKEPKVFKTHDPDYNKYYREHIAINNRPISRSKMPSTFA